MLKMITAICLISVVNVGCANTLVVIIMKAVQKAQKKALVSEARYQPSLK